MCAAVVVSECVGKSPIDCDRASAVPYADVHVYCTQPAPAQQQQQQREQQATAAATAATAIIMRFRRATVIVTGGTALLVLYGVLIGPLAVAALKPALPAAKPRQHRRSITDNLHSGIKLASSIFGRLSKVNKYRQLTLIRLTALRTRRHHIGRGQSRGAGVRQTARLGWTSRWAADGRRAGRCWPTVWRHGAAGIAQSPVAHVRSGWEQNRCDGRQWHHNDSANGKRGHVRTGAVHATESVGLVGDSGVRGAKGSRGATGSNGAVDERLM